MSDVSRRQNSTEFLLLLKAREGSYKTARWWQALQLIAAVLVPFLGGFAAMRWPDYKPLIAGYSLLIAILDTTIIDRCQRAAIKVSAKISEKFDCELLDMPRNPFVTGKDPDPEDIAAYASKIDPKQAEKLENWYPSVVDRAPIEVARLVCQRANLWYDKRVRSTYLNVLVALPIAYVSLLAGWALLTEASGANVVLSALAPAAPILSWSLRERIRQAEAIDANLSLNSEVEKAWSSLLDLKTDTDKARSRSRQLQDGIFNRRASSPLPFPFIYKLIRKKSETLMNHGAEEYIKSAGY